MSGMTIWKLQQELQRLIVAHLGYGAEYIIFGDRVTVRVPTLSARVPPNWGAAQRAIISHWGDVGDGGEVRTKNCNGVKYLVIDYPIVNPLYKTMIALWTDIPGGANDLLDTIRHNADPVVAIIGEQKKIKYPEKDIDFQPSIRDVFND